MHTICTVTSTRADYGILKPLIRRLEAQPDIDHRLVVTGMHLSPEFGYTVQEIKADGMAIHRQIEIQMSSDSHSAMSKTMGMTLFGFSDYFCEHIPDTVVLLGDRYEIAAVCCAAVNQRIPVAHIHGGEITEGAVDNRFRQAITKMSSLHFTSCETYRRRVIQMGEQPDTVFNVGAMGIENVHSLPRLTVEELAGDLHFPLEAKRYAVVTFHPVTLEDNSGAEQMKQLTGALDSFPELRFIITKANADAGGRKINRLWEEYCRGRDNCLLVGSLGATRYISALRHACMMIGNSSSGILEGPACGIPTVNIGDRQKGRLRAKSIIDCPPRAENISQSIQLALTSDFQELAGKIENPHGDGHTSEKIAHILLDFLAQGRLIVQKEFYDIDVHCREQ